MKIKYLHTIFLLLVFSQLYSQTDISTQVDKLASECWSTREINPDSSLSLGLKALALAEENKLDNKISKISNYIGVVYIHYLYLYKESIPHFQKAMRMSLLQKDSLQLAYAYNNLGDVYFTSGNIPLALEYATKSLDIFTEIGNESGISYSYNDLGDIYLEKKEYQKSLDCFQKAMIIREGLDATYRMGFVYYSQAKTYKELGELDTALNKFQQALSCSDPNQSFRYISWSLNGIADIHYARNEFQQAYEYYTKALEWNKNKNHVYGIIDDYLGLALVSAQLYKNYEGEELLNKAIDLALELGISAQIIKSYETFIAYYKILDDHENITLYYDAFFLRYDSILSAQQFEIVNELERNNSVQLELNQTEQKLVTNKLLRSRLFVIIILMVLVIIILILQYRSHRRMNKQLKEMNRTKDKLFSVISHDLKNPFNSLIGYSELLQKNISEEEFDRALEFAGYINKSSIEGLNLLTNLLQWSLSQSGKIEFNPMIINLDKLFKELEQLFLTDAEKYHTQLAFNNHVEHDITADQNIIKIVLNNLISNALKYTDENGKITVTSTFEDSVLKLQVKDTGTGMSQETIDQLFVKNSFTKSQKGLHEESGTGLGLSLVYELVQLHSGRIAVSSEEGNGSTFDIVLNL